MKKFTLFSFIATIILSAATSCSDTGNNTSTETFNRIEAGFKKPDSMQLAVYWYWISDNLSKEGVIKDLESMKQVGINRAFIGNIGLDEPGISYGKVKLLSPEWWEITHTALKKATELDIEIGIFNSPGWSQSGGPWVKPEQSMRYLASSEIKVKGPQKATGIKLPEVAKDAMEDVKIIAYPVPGNGQPVTEKSWKLQKKSGEALTLDMSLGKPAPIRTFIFKTETPDRIIAEAELLVKDGTSWRSLKKIHIDRSNPALNVGFDPYAPIVISVPETNASDFRFVMSTEQSRGNAEVTLTTQPLVERYPEKTLAKMFQTPLPMWDDYLWEKQPEIADDLCVDPLKVIDLTDKVRNGVLSWDIPEGEWIILRTAMRTTGVENAPASPEGRGLEIDKINKQHIASHFDAFIGEILRRIPEEDRKTFKVIVEDSYETGGLNWTDDMIEKFRAVYGYDPVPYIPVLEGIVVGSQDLSDRFLWDLRRLIADRVAYDYVGGLREISNKHGLTTWLENYGHWGFPGEFLMYGGQSDEIGGEFWSEGSLGDIENHAAASCGHTYGKRKIWAESCTSGGPVFSRYPNIMKQRLDRFFTEGINSTLLHVYIHQPYEDKNPGMAAWFGNEFNRKNTWYDHMDVFGQYLKRCNLMLQQGLFVADVAYFIGEDAPKMTGIRTPELPKGYAFDYMNAEVLLTRASVKDGKLTLPDGMQYSLLVLPQLESMRPEVLNKIKELVDEGLVIVGPAPKHSPSLQNYPDADKQITELASALWGNGSEKIRTVGKGKVFADGHSIEEVFAAINVQPDLVIKEDPQALFIHRTLPDGDIYFISNQSDKPIAINPQFRIAGKMPELWNPLTNEIRELKEFETSGKTTTVPLQLQGFESSFIVFRKNGKPSASHKNFPEKELIATVSAPWEVSFEPGKRGPEETVTFNKLEDWSQSSDERIRYFSGKAFYKTRFNAMSIPQKQLYIDLGKVMVMAKVKINGTYSGGVWTSPYRVNITGLLKEGENTVEVEVANNWMNRLIGDQQLPEKDRPTWVNVNPWKADSPLQTSGLLGPVEILAY
ncbi:MAG TPA: glycoside hydrolase family 2 [Porphyromonadaceae bacterium]|nr:glycoside hydrolase family 2 [Porphyromonadaceae bacterium]